MMDEWKYTRMHARTDGQTDGRTWATLNALPHSTNSGGIITFFLIILVESSIFSVGRAKMPKNGVLIQ